MTEHETRGFLPPSIAIPLTHWSGNLIDFSFFGRTSLNKGILSYSTQQISDRKKIWAAIAAGAVVAGAIDYLIKEQHPSLPLALEMVTGSVILGAWAHEKVMRPKVDNRKRIIADTDACEMRIRDDMQALDATIQDTVVNVLIPAIKNLTAATDVRANATMSLMKQKYAMQHLEHILANLDMRIEDVRLQDLFTLNEEEQLIIIAEAGSSKVTLEGTLDQVIQAREAASVSASCS